MPPETQPLGARLPGPTMSGQVVFQEKASVSSPSLQCLLYILSVYSKSICWAPYYVPVTVTGDRSEKNSERGQSSWPIDPAARWVRQTSKWAGTVASGCQKFCFFCVKNLALVSRGFRRRSLQFCLSGTRWFSSRKGPTVNTFHHPRQVFPRCRRQRLPSHRLHSPPP